MNVSIHASTLSLYTYIHALIQAQRIILLIHIAQPYRLRIYFKSYGSRSSVIKPTSIFKQALPALLYPYSNVDCNAQCRQGSGYIPQYLYFTPFNTSGLYTLDSRHMATTCTPHGSHMILTHPLLALQVSRSITAHTWPPHELGTWYTLINRDSDPPAYDSRPDTSVLRYLGLYTISHGTGRNPSHYSSRATTALYFSYIIISLQARLGTVATRLCYSFYTWYNTASMYYNP